MRLSGMSGTDTRCPRIYLGIPYDHEIPRLSITFQRLYPVNVELELYLCTIVIAIVKLCLFLCIHFLSTHPGNLEAEKEKNSLLEESASTLRGMRIM